MIGVTIAIIVAVGLVILVAPYIGYGKWWHRHDWYVAQEAVVPDMTSKYDNLYIVKKCKDCSAFKTEITEQKYK